jgi:hypothetical protein
MKPVRLPHQETVMSLDLRALIKETINFKRSLAAKFFQRRVTICSV